VCVCVCVREREREREAYIHGCSCRSCEQAPETQETVRVASGRSLEAVDSSVFFQ
jgi:hypothetical protein